MPFCSQKCPELAVKLYCHGSNSRRESQAPYPFPMEKYDQNMFVIKIFHVNILLLWEVVNLLEQTLFLRGLCEESKGDRKVSWIEACSRREYGLTEVTYKE